MSEDDFYRIQEDGIAKVDSTPPVLRPLPDGMLNYGNIIDPLPPGGFLPDLNLAGSSIDVASGSRVQPMPDPGRPWPMDYPLVGSPEMGGIDPSVPFVHLNLAGEMGMPTPDILAAPADNSIKEPTFTASDMSPTKLWPGDLSKDEINYAYGDEFNADPMMPDLTSYNQPYGLTIHNLNGDRAGLLLPDPPVDDLLDADVPDGMMATNHPLDPDPMVPDLQNPQLTQDVEMTDRPGDLDPSALGVMQQSPDYDSVKDVPYTQSRMDISGDNASRRRRMDLRLRGLGAVDDGGEL